MIERGRQIVLLDIALILGVSIATILTFVFSVGTGKLAGQMTRLFLTCLLCWLLYRGYVVARYALITLLSLAFALAAIGLPKALETGKPLGVLAIVAMGAAYAFVVANLAWSPDVREFLEHQQDSRNAKGVVGR